jgi:hypothetical protein
MESLLQLETPEERDARQQREADERAAKYSARLKPTSATGSCTIPMAELLDWHTRFNLGDAAKKLAAEFDEVRIEAWFAEAPSGPAPGAADARAAPQRA